MSIDIETDSDGLRTITLNEPDRRNPIAHLGRTELRAAFGDAAADESVRAVVLTGAGAISPPGATSAIRASAALARIANASRSSPTW